MELESITLFIFILAVYLRLDFELYVLKQDIKAGCPETKGVSGKELK